MPRRFIEYDGREWSLNALARTHNIAPKTLHHRLQRFPATATGVQRALATGIVDCRAAGRIGAQRSPWRYPTNGY